MGIIEYVKNVTDRQAAQEALQKSEERHRKLFEEARDGIVLADAETGIIVDCNDAAAELVGRDKSELIGQYQSILHPPSEIIDGISRTFRQHVQGSEGQVLEAQVITSAGEIYALMGDAFYATIDPLSIIQMGLLLVIMAVLASLIPAWQASLREPAEALHHI